MVVVFVRFQNNLFSPEATGVVLAAAAATVEDSGEVTPFGSGTASTTGTIPARLRGGGRST